MLRASTKLNKSTADPANEDKDYLTEVYCWGSDKFGQMGLAGSQFGLTYMAPRFCTFNIVIDKISCGDEHTAFIANGYLYTMGSNADGRLGISQKDIKTSSSPCLVGGLSRFVADQVSCGAAHTACLVTTGEVFTWGRGSDGQLGLGNTASQISPQLVQLPSDSYGKTEPFVAIAVSCGPNFTGIVTETGEVFMFGNGAHGQLGNGNKENELMPHKVRTFEEKISAVSCGNEHTLFLTNNGRVFACGSNKGGQLGTGNRKNHLYPQKVIGLDTARVTKIAARYHSAALTFKGELYVWGSSWLGENSSPVRVGQNFENVFVDIKMGENFTALLDLRGHVYTFGNNRNGELGQGDTQNRAEIMKVTKLKDKKVTSIACGKNFVIALGRTVSKADFYRELDQSICEGNLQQPERPVDEEFGDSSTRFTQEHSPYGIMDGRALPFDKEAQIRGSAELDFSQSFGAQAKQNGVQSSWTEGKQDRPRSLARAESGNLYNFNEELKKLQARVEYLEEQLEVKTRQNWFYEGKIAELQKFAAENEEKDKKMHELWSNIESEHQRVLKELNNREQLLLESKEMIKQQDQAIEELKTAILRFTEDKRNLIDLAQSFEYLRELEHERFDAATLRQVGKEEISKVLYGSQKRKSTENLDEMIKFYESRIDRLKYIIDWSNQLLCEPEDKQPEFSAQTRLTHEHERQLRDQSPPRTISSISRLNRGMDYATASHHSKESHSHNQPTIRASVNRVNTEPPQGGAESQKTPTRKRSALIKKNTALGSSATKSRSDLEKPGLITQNYHSNSQDTLAFYSHNKSYC